MRSSEASFEYCRWLTRRAGSNFSSSFLLLPPERRRAMEAVYAFCRAMDDVVDQEGIVPAQARAELDRWRRELDACEAGFPAHPIAVAIDETRRRYEIPVELFRKLIAGVEMDLERRRYGSFEELKVYCEHVASVVGLISVRVFGCKHPDADLYATDLGIAFQLTNILRDIRDDAERGRIYLPAEELARFGCPEKDVISGKMSDPLKNLLKFQADRAWEHFRSAQRAFRSSGEGRKLLPAQIMAGVYSRILRRIQQAGYDVYSRRIRVSKPEQAWVAVRCLATLSS